MFDDDFTAAAERCSRSAAGGSLTLATAESCTGGLVAAALTDIAGSSVVVDRGFVTYSNEAKQQMLGVTPATIDAMARSAGKAPRKWRRARSPMRRSTSPCRSPGSRGRRVRSGQADRSGLLLRRLAQRPHYRARPQIRGHWAREVRRASILQALAMLTELAEKEEPQPPAGQS